MNYVLHLFIYFCIYATVGLGLNIVVGYCGLLSLAQAAFFSVGCYCYALGALVFGWNLPEIFLCSVVLSSLLSLSVSLPAWRLRGDFFVMCSLAAQTMFMSILNNWSNVTRPVGTWSNLTNGPSGLPGLPTMMLGWIPIDSKIRFAVCAGTALGLALLVVAALSHSPWGRVLQCMRDDELAARGLGKNVRLLKLQAFAISSIISATIGILYAAYVGYVDPTLSSLDQSMLMLAMIVVGGLGTLSGPLAGAALLILIPELLRFLSIPDSVAGSLRLLVFGVLLIIFMHFRPRGLVGNTKLGI